MDESILLSVIIPCHNISRYLEECLDSIVHQTYKNLEVIMINDASDDDGKTADIIDAYAQKYANFFAYHNEENLSVGGVRNKGIKIAKGDYIAFADSDDVIPHYAYEKLVSTAIKTGSYVVTGLAHRFNKNRSMISYMHIKAFENAKLHVNLNTNPELLFDTVVWNDIYKATMFKEHDLKFPTFTEYEDIPFTAKAFAIATKESDVSMIYDVVYEWRVRDRSDDNKSLSELKITVEPYKNRIKMLNKTKDDLFSLGGLDSNVWDYFCYKILVHDIRLFMKNAAYLGEDFMLEFQQVTYLFFRDWDLLDKKNLYKNLPKTVQKQYKALLSGDFNAFLDLLSAPIKNIFGRMANKRANNYVFLGKPLKNHKLLTRLKVGVERIIKEPVVNNSDQRMNLSANVDKLAFDKQENLLNLKISGNISGEYSGNLAKGTIELLSKDKVNRYLDYGQVEFKGNHFKIKLPLKNKNVVQMLSGTYQIFLSINIDNAIYKVKVGSTSSISVENIKLKRDVFSFYTNKNNLYVSSSRKAAWTDRTRLQRLFNYYFMYPVMRMLPIDKKVVVFESFWGKYFNDNPKAIYNYLAKHHPELKFIWLLNNDQIQIDGPGKVVKRGDSLKYWYYMARAKYLVQNTNFQTNYAKRAGQIEVSTLHGTFMKTMGFDEPYFKDGSNWMRKMFSYRNSRWDLLTVPSEYMADRSIKAFEYDKEIVDSGFPRNDELYNNNNDDYINKIRTNLNIPSDKKVVLYAPTYRTRDGYDLKLDLKKLKEKLGNDYVFLVRLHYFVAHSVTLNNYDNCVDVSDYANINDLYLVSDVLITDYSSVMFDYGHLNRPMIFYAYDIDWYLDGVNRGVYLDYKKIVPGPIVDSTDKIIELLQNLDELRSSYQTNLNNFYNQFCTYGRSGDASQKISERMLSFKPGYQENIIKGLEWWWLRLNRYILLEINFLKLFTTVKGYLTGKRNIVFESYYVDYDVFNLKDIFNYIKQNYPKYNLYWISKDKDVNYFKDNKLPYITENKFKDKVTRYSAKYWFTNDVNYKQELKFKNSKVVQLSAGNSLYLAGNSLIKDYDGTEYYLDYVNDYPYAIRNSSTWNYVVAPNINSFNEIDQYLRKPLNIITTGYPRIDRSSSLLNARTKFNLDEDSKIILYDVVGRSRTNDNQFRDRHELVHELQKLLTVLDDNVIILVKTTDSLDREVNLNDVDERVKDVSDYGKVADLYEVSDVLVTGCNSSALYDYVNFNKPIILFDDELNLIANKRIGEYESIIDTGVLVKDIKELSEVINDVLNNPDVYTATDQYQDLVKKYRSWGTKDNTKTIVDYILSNEQYRLVSNDLDEMTIKLPDGIQLWESYKNDGTFSFKDNYNLGNEDVKVVSEEKVIEKINNLKVGHTYLKIKLNNQTLRVRKKDVLGI